MISLCSGATAGAGESSFAPAVLEQEVFDLPLLRLPEQESMFSLCSGRVPEQEMLLGLTLPSKLACWERFTRWGALIELDRDRLAGQLPCRYFQIATNTKL